MTTLINEIAALPHRLVLVLDDYHLITSESVHGGLTFLLDHMPPKLRLVIAGRTDPPLPLHLWRARRQVTELRAADLRFTSEEAAAFLNEAMGLGLPAEQVTALKRRTEGWITGLQLAALSMQGRDDVAGFVQAFAGSHRYVLDYLAEEVLHRQTQAVQTFLLQTSVLERLAAPLCDAVTGHEDGFETLRALDRANLFIVPLDDERRWYRYHHLFAEVLRAFLRRDVGKEGLAPLHTRAAEWYEAHGEINAAFKHAIAAQDFERAARLVEENWLRVGHAGNMNTILRWLESMPDEIIQERPMLRMAFAWALWLTGQTDAVEPYLDAVATTWEGQPTADVADPHQVRLRVGTLILRMYLARHRGQLEEMLGFARRALALAPPDDALLRGYGHLGLAHAYHELGDYEESRSACVEGMSLMRTASNVSSANLTTFYLCRMLTLLGRLGQADQVVRKALQLANAQELAQSPACGILHVALASVSRERNDLEKAEAHLGQGLILSRQGGHHDCVRNGALLMARLRLAEGHPEGALEAIQEAEQAIAAAQMPLASAELAAWQSQVWIAQGNLSAAARWAEEAVHRPGQDRGYTRQIEALTRARVLRAQGKLDQALDQLTLCQQMADETGAWGWAIEIGIIRALVYGALGNRAEALADLGRALARAEPEGYVQVFVDEGRPMAALLNEFLDAQSRGRRADLPNVSQEFVCRLLDALDQTTAGQEPAATSDPSLIEPLTERELEVLRLMATGLSNQEIADELVVALGTVKAHLHNIYGKLSVRGRTQAAARARELNLL